jgi:hypothetical protein
MVARARRKLLGRFRQGVYHCTARCVRQMFLCGWDPLTGRDYSYRRGWIIQREEQLAGLFAIDIEFRAELRTHLHLVLRTMPEVARRWSPREVALRWLTATRLAKSFGKGLPQVDEELVDALVQDTKQIERLRRRLASVSWFMGFLCENVARRANAEEDRVGHFWQARFRCRECTDRNAVLLCGIYVDLNLIRAGEADSLESSPYTSIFQRLQAWNQPKDARNRADGWLGELTWDVSHEQDASGAYYRSRTGRRASDLGLLPIKLEDYVRLLRYTLELLQSGRTTIPADMEAMLERLDIRSEAWLETVERYDETFTHAVGSPAGMAEVAQRMQVRALKGVAASRRVFA